MKKIYNCFILLLTAFSVSTCVLPLEEEKLRFDGAYGVDLSVICTKPGTKAPVSKHGVDEYNENKVDHVDWFIFKSSDDTGDAFLCGRTSISQGVQDGVVDTAVVIKKSISFDDYVEEYGNSFYVFTLANLPDEYSFDNTEANRGIMKGDVVIGKKLESLRSIALKAAFGEVSNGKFKPQDSFVMSGGKSFAFEESDKGTVKSVVTDLKRVASKITIKLNVAPAIDEQRQLASGEMKYERTWYPVLAPVQKTEANGLAKDLNGIQVYMSFANNAGKINVEEATLPSYNQQEFFTYNRYAFIPKYSYLEMTKTATGGHTYNYIGPKPSADLPNLPEGWVDNMKLNWQVTGTPFYTYPMKWESASPQAPFIKIILEWRPYIERDNQGSEDAAQKFKRDEEGKLIRAARVGASDSFMGGAKEFFYKIPIPEQANYKLLPNEWYELTFNVSILGSTSDELPLELRGQYCVANWSDSHVEAGGNLVQGSYLDTDADVYYIYGGNDITIPVTSSHELVNTTANPTKVLGVDFTDYSRSTGPRHYTYPSGTYTNGLEQKPLNINTTISGTTFDRRPKVEFENSSDHTVKFTHLLVSDINANTTNSNNPPDVSVYEFTVQISNSAGKTKTIKIVQYPPLVITNETNTHTDRGYVIVNGNRSSNTYYDWNEVNGRLGSDPDNNNNPNMYIITTSVVPQGKIVADPRQAIENNLTNWNPSLQQGYRLDTQANGILSHYHPTDRSNYARNIIAPKFRIASSFGKIGEDSFANMQKRCASYQEYGYPAGRWRIPTRAEMEYMMTLSGLGVIPVLFRNNYTYFTADGGVLIPRTTGAPTYQANYQSNSVARCVYDEWYWGNSKISNMDTFTWGDIAY